ANFAGTCGRSRFVAPIILKIAGRTNCKNVTNADTGFPGRPKIRQLERKTEPSPALRVRLSLLEGEDLGEGVSCSTRPNKNGFPGLTATRQISIFTPSSHNASFTKSC